MNREELLQKAVEYYSAEAVETLSEAIDFSTRAHQGQKRASGEDYIIHPLAVAGLLIDWKLDIDTVIAGVLHDTVEDTSISLEDIERKFGTNVAFLVNGVTKISKMRSGRDNINNYLPQTKDNLSKLLIAISQDVRVLLVKLADRLHNMRTLEYLSVEKQQKIAHETLEIFAPLADRLGFGELRVELEEIAFSYINPEEHGRLKKITKQQLSDAGTQLHAIKEELHKTLLDFDILHDIDGRTKSIYSLHKKLKKYNGDIRQIHDLMALRIIVDEQATCYHVLGLVHTMYQPMLTKIKDYIAVPKPNGYQSLHTTVITPNEQIVEIQIRSRDMHEHAERGLAAAFHYNEQKLTSSYADRTMNQVPRNMRWIARLQHVYERLKMGEDISPGELSVDMFIDRIFVYSPKGDIYELPEGSRPLDFAYAVHSEIAEHAHSFKVNSKIAPFNKELQNGDIIEVITRKNVVPKADWLDYVRTARARQKIRARLGITSAKH